MDVRRAVGEVMKFVEGTPSIMARFTRYPEIRDFLMAYMDAFGERDVLDVGISEIQALIDKEHLGELIEDAFIRSRNEWRKCWKDLSVQKYVKKEKLAWEWESSGPNSALVKLFEQPGFAPKKVLELGCADGMNALFMAQRGCDVTAVDISDTAVHLCRENAQAVGVSCHFIAADILDLPLDPGASFDLIVDKECFHHIPLTRYPDYKKVILSLLAPGGSYFLICHRYDEEVRRPSPIPYLGVLSNVFGFLMKGPGVRSTERNIREVFQGEFQIHSIEKVHRVDELSFPFVCLMRKKERHPDFGVARVDG